MKPLIMLALVGTCVVTKAGATETMTQPVTIHTTVTRDPISPMVYGQFIEHLGRCIYGGIWAEMLEDRKFFYPVTGERSGWDDHVGDTSTWQGEGVPYEILVASPWQIIGPPDTVHMEMDDPFVGEHDPSIQVKSHQPAGIAHPRIALLRGRSYTGHIVLRASGAVDRIELALVWADGEQAVAIEVPGNEFERRAFEMRAGADDDDARFEIRCHGDGTVRIAAVSLMPADNVDGFRRDTLALMRELHAPIYRWPGGNFVSGYDWRDGIGDRDRRPPRKNPAWSGIEHNDVGIHEYMRLCELLEAEPFVALNTGLGDAASAVAEVEYITGSHDTTEGARRAANGRREPWKATWWAVGNEMYGGWQLGHMPLAEYVEKHKEFVDAIRRISPQAKCVAVGQAGAWSETMLRECGDYMELISEHLYWQHKPEVSRHVDVAARQIEWLAATHRRYRAELDALAGKDIRIALDEWNYWYGPNVYGELGVRYFMRDALGVAAAMHAMFRNSDLFYMANYAQTVNVIGAIKTTPTRAFFATTGQVLKLYRHRFGTIPVSVECRSDGVDVAAAWLDDRSGITVAVVNTLGTAVVLALNADGLDLARPGEGWAIHHADPEAFNDATHPDNVTIRSWSSDSAGQPKLEPYSVTLFTLAATNAH